MRNCANNDMLKKFCYSCRAFFVFFVLFVFITFCSCSLFYDYEKVGAFGIGYSKIENSAFIADFDYSVGERKIVLPSEYEGIKINALGGYFGRGVPSPFGLSVNVKSIFPEADEYYATSENYLYDKNSGWWDETQIIDCSIEIVLPEYLEKIVYLRLDEIAVAEYKTESGKILAKIFRPTFSFSISETNENFFTSNGRLYRKTDGSLVEEIVYSDNSEIFNA